MRVMLVAALAAAIVASSALAAAGDPRERHTVAGARTAQKALLKRSDFPKEWKATPSTPIRSNTLCKDTRPNLSDLTEVGYARSPDYSLGRLQHVTQWARTFGAPKQAAAAFMRTATIGLVACLEKQLLSAANSKTKITITGRFRLPVPKVAQEIDAFRVVAHTNVPSEKEKFDVYADVIVIRQGSTLTTITTTGFIKPVDAGFQARLVRSVATRLGAKPSVA